MDEDDTPPGKIEFTPMPDKAKIAGMGDPGGTAASGSTRSQQEGDDPPDAPDLTLGGTFTDLF
jgi:hypothetical protein